MFFLFFSFSSSCFSFFLILVNLFFYSFICVFLHTLAFSSFHSLFLILSLLHSFSSSSLHPLFILSLILSSSSLILSHPPSPVCWVRGGGAVRGHSSTDCVHTHSPRTHSHTWTSTPHSGWVIRLLIHSFIHLFACLFACLMIVWLTDWNVYRLTNWLVD